MKIAHRHIRIDISEIILILAVLGMAVVGWMIGG